MGKLPSAVIIVRHGSRLDSADKEWHLTSPTPYDPPLSYGGWLQSSSLGIRIGSLLRSTLNSEYSAHAPQTVDQAVAPMRNHRIIIHTSPYLRCLQTAISVSAGINQRSREPELRTSGADNSCYDQPCILRVDACLGEWLTPDYFEEITPPPSSDRMIMAAKAELLRRGEDLPFNADIANRSANTGYFPGGWASSSSFALPDVAKSSSPSIQGYRNRAASYGVSDTTAKPRPREILARIDTNVSNVYHRGYVPPTPRYAISLSDPIPLGYVAHARDACSLVDYQWDSMRGPQNWGHGGVYGEEWSSMHSRFRRILQNMVNWYGEHGYSALPTSSGDSNKPEEDRMAEEGDEESDIVLVIVTHGAGCNALIGALTGEPALVDVGTASLTMATLKAAGSSHSADLPQEYSLKLIASTDHLRHGVDPSDLSALSSPKPAVLSPNSSYRYRLGQRHSPSQSPFIVGPFSSPGSAIREASSSRPSSACRASPGLWGQDDRADSTDEIMPNFDGPDTPALPASCMAYPARDNIAYENFQYRTLPQPGLWGSAPLSQERETGLGRRWTVSERRV